MRLRGSDASLSFALIFVDDAKKFLCIMEEIHKLKGDFIMYEYDYAFWKEIDKMLWSQLKWCMKVLIRTLVGLVVTLAMQPVRLYEYARWRWYNREEAQIEREENERIKSIPWSCSLEGSGGRLFLWRERRSVLTFSIADLTEKVSCNCWKSNRR